MKSTVNNQTIRLQLNDAQLLLVRIPPGKFSMGSPPREVGSRENERPVHDVQVSSFHFGIYPITQFQWRAVMKKLPDIAPDFLGDELPVVNVWLEHAHDFCQALRELTGLPFRLPSEAEWEYACRADTTTPFAWGTTITGGQVNFRELGTPLKEEPRLKPVGFSGVTNAFGLFDMHGNVWEWCSDTWHDSYDGAPIDGSSWIEGGDAGYHVQRGGSWTDQAIVCRSAFRVGDIAHNSDHIVGLRVCVTIP
jgi:formylglycine-generating enzyme required for sulfatase activity